MKNRPICYIDRRGLPPRNMVKIQERPEVCQISIFRRAELGLPPEELNDEIRICQPCYQNILEDIRLINENPHSLRLKVLWQTRNNSCFICNRENNLHRLTIDCEVNVFVKCNIYLPETVRSCNVHLDRFGNISEPLLGGLQSITRQCVIPGRYLQSFMQALRDNAIKNTRLNDLDNVSEEETLTLTSLSKAQFDELFTYCDTVPNRRITRKDFLCKMRQGLSDEFLTLLFKYSSRQMTSIVIAAVRESLMLRFVPENLGLNAITRAQYIREHVTEFSNMLYNNEPHRPTAIVYIDGTYTYTHKSSNFRALRQTYSRHKSGHLVKPALMVAPDGYILDVHGPFFSDSRNNDASMMRYQWENDENLRNCFEDRDVFIVDRGYRDVVPMLENLGFECRMSPLLEPGQNQLSTEDANEARMITKTRWIVEARNGHIKSKFKYLGNDQ
uniref:DDE Tnp4 domain-containing protein n=1 Tax=Trichogramma kaykai TaxID=54128 RepID=A0ABD2WGS7_9HYME